MNELEPRPQRPWSAGRRSAVLLALAGALLFAQAAAAQSGHVDNPFVGATMYVSPDYTAKADAQAAQTSNATLAAQMRTAGRHPTAVWLDRIAAINGTGGGRGLAAHLDAALAQRQGRRPSLR